MLEVRRGFDFLDFDKVSFTKTLDRILGQIIREAARTWLRAVLTSVPERGGFPVLTGAAKSTLTPLGRTLRVAVPVRPVPAKGRSKIVDRTEEGEQSQEFMIISSDFQYVFEWSTGLLHYYLNDVFPMLNVQHTPWESVEKGEQAMIAYIENAIATRLPNIADYIEIRKS